LLWDLPYKNEEENGEGKENCYSESHCDFAFGNHLEDQVVDHEECQRDPCRGEVVPKQMQHAF
jgi:hypothetical protein